MILFGEKIYLWHKNAKFLPEYTNQCRTQYFKNVSLKENFDNTFSELKNQIRKLFETISGEPERTRDHQLQIYELFLHLFYLLKIIKQKFLAQAKLKALISQDISIY